MQKYFEEQNRLLNGLSKTKRYLFKKINWSLPLLGIFGARGTGKTTMMLQYVRDFQDDNKVLYVAVDHPWFISGSIYDFALEFYNNGGETLLIDEVHKYPKWAAHIKSIYDNLPSLQVIFSGSSLLQISQQDADLSRRAVVFYMHGMSFREYLSFTLEHELPMISLEAVLTDHVKFAQQITRDIRIIKLFKEYLKFGYYPFVFEGVDTYPLKLNEVINQIIEIDLTIINNIDSRQIAKIKKLLYFLATSVPYMPDLTKLSAITEISRPKLYEYLEHLEKAKLINIVREKGQGDRVLTKPEKMYLNNSNLMFSITDSANIGAIREVFFVNQIRNFYYNQPQFIGEKVECLKNGDFFVDSRYTFEIGGKNKNFDQIKNIEQSYLVLDDIEIGYNNKIPLWIFGWMY